MADTFDLLPGASRGRQTGEERESQARIFTAQGRAELWAAGAGTDEGRAPMAGAARAHEEREMERELEKELGSDATTGTDGAGGELGRAFDRWGREGGK